MINKVYQLIEPFQFIETYRDIKLNDKVIVRPKLLAICKADQRYFLGNRDQEILNKKLPMALIHEAIGEVVFDSSNKFKIGDQVIMVPNTPDYLCNDFAENYVQGKFRGSGFDGFMQEFIDMDSNRLIKANDIDRESLVMCETLSVAHHGINAILEKAQKIKKPKVAIIGDGPIAFSTSLIIKFLLPDAEISLFGKHDSKLKRFQHIENKFNTKPTDKDNNNYNFVFECVGGSQQNNIVIEAIKLLIPEGTIILLGISDSDFNFKYRDLLEKGITIIGRSRSGYDDFKAIINLMKNKEFSELSKNLIDEIIVTESLKDVSEAFSKDLKNEFKTVIEWKI